MADARRIIESSSGMRDAKPVVVVNKDAGDDHYLPVKDGALVTAIATLTNELTGLRADIAAMTTEIAGKKRLRTADTGL